jgi:hypothetical protein
MLPRALIDGDQMKTLFRRLVLGSAICLCVLSAGSLIMLQSMYGLQAAKQKSLEAAVDYLAENARATQNQEAVSNQIDRARALVAQTVADDEMELRTARLSAAFCLAIGLIQLIIVALTRKNSELPARENNRSV